MLDNNTNDDVLKDTYVSSHVIKALVNGVYNVSKLFAGWWKSWILKALRQVVGLSEMLKAEPNVFTDLVEPLLLLNKIFTGII